MPVEEIVQTDFEVEFRPASMRNGRVFARKLAWRACASLRGRWSAPLPGRSATTSRSCSADSPGSMKR